MRHFSELIVWQKAHQLTLDVYEATRGFPREELYGLTNQVRRAASSIPANIAEGCGRSSNAELARFIEIGIGSAFELEYHFLLARDLTILDSSERDRMVALTIEVRKMLISARSKLLIRHRSVVGGHE